MTKFSTLQQTVHLRSRAKFHPDQFILLPLGLVAKKKQIVLHFQLGAIDTKLNAGTQLQLKMSPAAFSTFVTQTFIYTTISKPLTSSNALMAKAEALSQMHSKSDGQKHRPSRVLSHAPLHRWRWNLAGRSRSTPLRQIPPPSSMQRVTNAGRKTLNWPRMTSWQITVPAERCLRPIDPGTVEFCLRFARISMASKSLTDHRHQSRHRRVFAVAVAFYHQFLDAIIEKNRLV